MLATLKSLTLFGLEAHIVDIEVDIHPGLPRFSIVGLGDTAIQESRERVRSAIKNSGFKFPRKNITVNLAPADLRKNGPRFDLGIALGILMASGQLDIAGEKTKHSIWLGELGFTGDLRPITGILPSTAAAAKQAFKQIFVPTENSSEAAFVESITAYGISNLKQITEFLQEEIVLSPTQKKSIQISPAHVPDSEFDLRHIRGNEHAKRALEIAAAGGHNILMSGPPGSGKSMLAKSLATILPKLSLSEALEITNIHSIAGLTDKDNPVSFDRPFRSIHHTASGVAIIGGGNPPKPGEISLAHRGVLFLDEFPEFPTKTLEVLRQPLEDGVVTVSRASGTCVFPAQMMLVAAMNPTPCGYEANDDRCTSTPFEIQRYQNKISGPLLDRIDLHIQVPHLPFETIQSLEEGEPSSVVRTRVEKARDIQSQRFRQDNIHTNAEMSSALVKKYCPLDEESKNLLRQAANQMGLSGRAFYRILKLARTIADLAEQENIMLSNIAEAIQYREQK